MKIAISEKYRPFSHEPGVKCLIPGTDLIVEGFPLRVRIFSLHDPSHLIWERRLVFGEGFTLQQDLERGRVSLFGKEERVLIGSSLDQLWVQVGKGEKEILPRALSLPSGVEKLSFGVTKRQEWEPLWRRFDLREIIPLIYSLAQRMPKREEPPLFEEIEPSSLEEWKAIFLSSFHDLSIPRLFDSSYEEKKEGNPLNLLQNIGWRLRASFFRQKGKRLFLLPAPLFVAGRMTNIRVEGIGSIDLEWKKNLPSRLFLRATQTEEIFVSLPLPVGRFRMRQTGHQKGSFYSVEEPLPVVEGQVYWLDRFA